MQAWNESVFRAIWSATGNSFLLDSLAVIVSRYLGYAAIIGAILLLISNPDWRMKVLNLCKLFLALVLIRGVLTSLIKFFYESKRPAEVLNIDPLVKAIGNSFPAENMVTLFIFVTLSFAISKRWGLVFLGISLLSGLAQIFSGIHWPQDVVGGALMGIVGVLIINLISRKYERKIISENNKQTENISETITPAQS